MTDALHRLLEGLDAHVQRGDLTLPLLFVLICWLGPVLWAWWWRAVVLRKIVRLHEEIIQQKDAELARMVKLYGGPQLARPGPATAPPVETLSRVPSARE
jgi:hypothetical protein